MTTKPTIMLSGGFDPIHIGHVRMVVAAAEVGTVIVVANSDEWLMRKKGYIFMPWEERAEILKALRGVSEVVSVEDTDGTVCEVLRRLKPDIFGNGGDRNNKNTPEKAVCKELGIKMAWGLGGTKVQSSSELVSESNLISDLGPDIPDIPRPDKRILLRGKNNEN
jgi:D-beta-D-heptose 7-phosphate kinase/D-beta-D-heptose 1-phosphate adenosyltransferase